MKNNDIAMHVRGTSQFVDDIVVPAGCLHGALYTSPIAHGRITSIDTREALRAPGVVAVFTHRDVPGVNEVGHVLRDQPLFAFDEVSYIGQPIALVVADTREQALSAAQLVKVQIQELEAVFDPLEAAKRGMIHGKKRVMSAGDTKEAFKRCKYIAQGSLQSGAQEHFYFETQRALALPGEHDTLKVCASTQSPGTFHRHIAEVCGIPQHKVELDIRRLGGGFGGKESTAVWVVAPAMAAFVLKRPVKLVLSRNEDIATTGKRHAYHYDYKIGVDENGRILAFEADLFQHAGACADISLAVLGRSLLHTTGSYTIENVRISAVSCKTNIPPNNAFRGFGVPQGTFCIESAITHVAQLMGVHPTKLKRINLLQDGHVFPYGMKLEHTMASKCWQELDERVGLQRLHDEINEYNRTHERTKRGIAVIPVCFGISFAQTALNQASSLVNIYVDGSVSVSTGAVEMGQGVNTKIGLIAAKTLGIAPERVRVDTTNTLRIPNASPTSASTGADLNGMATKQACEVLSKRLCEFAVQHLRVEGVANEAMLEDISIEDGVVCLRGVPTKVEWKALIAAAHWARVDLSCHDFYATPNVYHDQSTEKGRPFAYYSYAVSVTQVTLDCVRGTYQIDSVDIVQDVGQSLSKTIDLGQIEGAVVQGIGWATLEQLRRDASGRVITLANAYKIPDIKFGPKRWTVSLLANSNNPFAVSNSKAVGEPPFVHGLGAYFAILDALRAVRKDLPAPALPLTPEKVFMYLHDQAPSTEAMATSNSTSDSPERDKRN